MRGGAAGLWRGARTLVACAALVAASAAPAAGSADQQPPILKAYNLDWIERVDPSAFVPPAQRPVICLLDTGVNVTPDTPADHPDGPIVARLALDGGSGEAQGTTPLHLHGTQMASIIAAPRNDWGTVGVFPGARIVSVRATLRDDVHVAPAAMLDAVYACTRWAAARGSGVSAVVMAESLYDQRPTEVSAWRTAAAEARELGGLFFMAVGNQSEAEIVAPLLTGTAFAVGAGDRSGAICHFSPVLPSEVLLGPGCDAFDRTWPHGSSAATATAGALAGALAARAPALSSQQRGEVLASSAVQTESQRPRIDGRRIADEYFAGFIPVETPVPIADAQGFANYEADDDASRILLWRPKISAVLRRKRLQVRRLTHRSAGRLVIQFREGAETRSVSTRHNQLTVRVRRGPARVTAWAESVQPGKWRSLSRTAGVVRR